MWPATASCSSSASGPSASRTHRLSTPARPAGRLRSTPTVDVIEWLGNEQYAYIPYEAPADIAAQLAELEQDLDSEQMRTQLWSSLDPTSRVPAGGTGHALVRSVAASTCSTPRAART